MKMSELEYGGQPPIDGYAPGGFRVAGRFLEGALLIGPGGTETLAAASAAEVAPETLARLAGAVDVLVLGAGDAIAAAPPPLGQAMAAAGVGVEPMATPAACRTYNVMLSEGRRVAALLIPISTTG